MPDFPPIDPTAPSLEPGETLDLSWEMFGELCRALAFRIHREYDPEIVLGIARAGVIPGAVVASILGVDFYSMTISRREGGERVRDRPAVLSAAPRRATDKRVLIVDEITSSGETLRLALAAARDVHSSEVRTATSFVRPSGYKPDYFALETGAEIIFPWDRKIVVGDELVVNPRYRGILDE